MSTERLLEHADAVRAAHDADRDRLRRKLARLDRKIAAGHTNLEPFRTKIAAAAGGR